jgi:hypothetical protein
MFLMLTKWNKMGDNIGTELIINIVQAS